MEASNLKVGTHIILKDKILVVTEYNHRSQSRGSAFIKVKLKNIETGQVIEHKFSTTDYIEKAQISRKEMQYLYNDGNLYYFMDNETFEQTQVNKKDVLEALPYIKENMTVTVNSCKGKVISVSPPLFVELVVTHTEAGIQGDSQRAGTKPAVLETNHELKVPLFVNINDKIKVDTRNGEYVERL
jgi:elongation factor P